MATPLFIILIPVPTRAGRRKKDRFSGARKLGGFEDGFFHAFRTEDRSTAAAFEALGYCRTFASDNDRDSVLLLHSGSQFVITFALPLSA